MKKSIHLFMKLSASFALLAILLMPTKVSAQYFENFNSFGVGSTPEDGSFSGNFGYLWYYMNCRGGVFIYGNAITLGSNGEYSQLSAEITGSIQYLSFDYMQTGPNPVIIYVRINGQNVNSFQTSVEQQVVNTDIIYANGEMDALLELIVEGGQDEVTIDNIYWEVSPENLETFDDASFTENFESGSFIGVNNHEWYYNYSKDGIYEGPAITLAADSGALYCSDILFGMNILRFEYRQNNADPVFLKVFINNEYFATISSDNQNTPNTTEDFLVNIAGDGNELYRLEVRIENAYDEENTRFGGEVTIDNIYWNNLSYSYTEFNGTGNWSDASKWSSGIPDRNFTALIKGNATLNVPANSHYVGIEPLGTLTLQSSTLNAKTLSVRADATGSGSLIGSSAFLNLQGANMVWHISSGVPNAWHLLSSPIPNQQFYNNANSFAPSGSYPDGTGYDSYAWDEPTEMWLNRKLPENNINSFMPGKGYLVAYQNISTDKIFYNYFEHTFNSGTITIPVTAPGLPGKSSNGIHAGANLLGNPYPSSIDWKSSALDRNNLKSEEGGYVLYIWDDVTKNYGTYNHNSAGDVGTLGVSRYIPPLQGFFVIAQTSGNFVFNDAARVHSSQMYMKSGNEEGFRISVQAPADAGKDEILLDFGHAENQGGAEKWKSMSAEAPSLYVSSNEKDYSIRFLSSASDNSLIPLAFKAGMNGEYTIRASYSTATIPSVQLKDLLTGNIHDLSANPEYTFTAGTGDDANRFELIFGALGIDHPESESGIQVYAHAGILYLNSQSKANATVKVYNLTGQLVMEGKAGSKALTTLNASHLGTGVYMVNLLTDEKVISQKVAFTK